MHFLVQGAKRCDWGYCNRCLALLSSPIVAHGFIVVPKSMLGLLLDALIGVSEMLKLLIGQADAVCKLPAPLLILIVCMFLYVAFVP